MVLHGNAWYCIVMHGIAWYFMVLHGIALYCMVLHGIAWYCMVLHGIAWYYMVLHGIARYCMVLHGIVWYCDTWYLSWTPRIYSCKFFLAGVNYYRFNAKNWHFRKVAFFLQIQREKLAFFGVNFSLKKFCPCKKRQIWGMHLPLISQCLTQSFKKLMKSSKVLNCSLKHCCDMLTNFWRSTRCLINGQNDQDHWDLKRLTILHPEGSDFSDVNF